MKIDVSKVLGVFDGAMVVHAPHISPERRISFEKELKKVGIEKFEVIDAIIGTESLRGSYNYNRPSHQNSIRALSVILSIDKAIKTAKKQGLNSVLLMQDDIIFRDKFKQMWSAIKHEVIAVDWDMLFFYRWHQKPIREPIGRMRLLPIEHTLCSHCVAIKSSVFDEYRSVLHSAINLNQMDDSVETFKLMHDKGFKLYATNRNLAGQGDFSSTLSAASRRTGMLEQFRIDVPNWRVAASKLYPGYHLG